MWGIRKYKIEAHACTASISPLLNFSLGEPNISKLVPRRAASVKSLLTEDMSDVKRDTMKTIN
jgi:hypothetical protein